MPAPLERKKRFSAKVKTGCVNCKARRTKCPEEKPECFNCLKSGLICSYAKQQIKPFQPKKVNGKAQNCFFVFEAEKKTPTFDLQSKKPKSPAEYRTVTNAFQTMCRLQPSDIPFEVPLEKAAFGFYITSIGPMLSRYVHDGQFFKTVVPQFAWQSRAVRELIIALVNADQTWFASIDKCNYQLPDSSRLPCELRAVRELIIALVNADQTWFASIRKSPSDQPKLILGHYQKALQDITEGRTSKIETLIAATIAWTVDITSYNAKASQLHLQGARSLLKELEGEVSEARNYSTYRLLHDVVEPFMQTAEELQIATPDQLPELDYKACGPCTNFEIYQSLRDQISECLAKYRNRQIERTEVAEGLKSWNSAVRKYAFRCGESMTLKQAMHAFYAIAIALERREDGDAVIYGSDNTMINHVLNRVVTLLKERHALEGEEVTVLIETLKLVVTHLFDLFPAEGAWQNQKALVVETVEEYPEVFERTSVLQMLDVQPLTLPPPLSPDEAESKAILHMELVHSK